MYRRSERLSAKIALNYKVMDNTGDKVPYVYNQDYLPFIHESNYMDAIYYSDISDAYSD
jgi:hypothetical protein